MENNHPATGNGKICYIQVPAIDVESSAAFYKEVFSWNIRRRDNGIIAFDDTTGEVSGQFVRGRKVSDEPGLLIYIMVDSVAEALESVVAGGGKVVQPIGMDAPEITARFTDPAGNVLGLYQEPK